jgi:GNAT superfamily N-acetyltransferase
MQHDSHNKPFTFRSARPADAPRLAELSSQLGYPATAQEIRRRLAALARARAQRVLVAVQGGEVVAWMHVGLRRSLEMAPCAEVVALVVDAAVRRAGIGRALLARAEAWARARALPVILVRSNILRGEAHAFYEALGYRRMKTQHVYQKTLCS